MSGRDGLIRKEGRKEITSSTQVASLFGLASPSMLSENNLMTSRLNSDLENWGWVAGAMDIESGTGP